jgi:DNA-directed RNA polymerase subunit M/transcription elongation factor TFIIS
MEKSVPVDDLEGVTCQNCGANLTFKPGSSQLVCRHCGSVSQIGTSNVNRAKIQKENHLSYMLAGGDWQTDQQGRKYMFTCPACDAESTIEKNLFNSKCSFCGSTITIDPEIRTYLKPHALLPFHLDIDQASRHLKKWLRQLWLGPNGLKEITSGENLTGVYLPYWLFRLGETSSAYNGRKGVYHGQDEHRVLQWTPVSGNLVLTFKSFLIPASRSIASDILEKLQPWDLDELLTYDPRYLSGFRAEVCQMDLDIGFSRVKGQVAQFIKNRVLADIGGDEQEFNNIETAYPNAVCQYILLPMWLGIYHYNRKMYRYIVNARTGEIFGERPYSWAKIITLILFFVVFLLMFYFFLR